MQFWSTATTSVRVTDSLNALKLNGLSVSSAGISVSSDAEAVRTRQSEEANSADKVAVQERLTIKLSGINTMDPDEILQSIIRIVDTVKDAGMTPDVGARAMIQMQYDNSTPVALATFKVSNSDALRRQAYETAAKKSADEGRTSGRPSGRHSRRYRLDQRHPSR